MAENGLNRSIDPVLQKRLLEREEARMRKQLENTAGSTAGTVSASTVRVTPESLKKDSRTLYTCASEIKKTTESITAMVTKLTGQVWSGSAQSAFVAKFKALQDQITPVQDALIKHSENLDKIADMYDQTEKAAQKRSEELPSDVFGEG